MELTPFQLQLTGIAIIVLIGLGFLWWVVRSVMQWHSGRPLYILPETRDEETEDDDDRRDGDDGDGGSQLDAR